MAKFEQGFAYEWDQSGHLKVEGNLVPVPPSGGPSSQGGPIPTERTVELVRHYLEDSGALQQRTAQKAEHVRLLCAGKDPWNEWRRGHRDIPPMLACLEARELEGRSLAGYDLSYANLTSAELQDVHLEDANFHQAILAGADLSGAHLEGANFCRTDLYRTRLVGAHLNGANLQGVQMAMTDLSRADLRGCTVYGLSAWDLTLTDADQRGLIVRYKPRPGNGVPENTVKVDSLDLAAILYLAVDNANLARVVNAASRQWVLLLGRFSDGKKEVLDEVANALRRRDLIPIIFDFSPPEGRDRIESILLLAGMSAFVIADITDPRSTPMELLAIASNYGVPIVPILHGEATAPFATFSSLRRFRWVGPLRRYQAPKDIVDQLDELIVWATQEVRRHDDGPVDS
jgi:hypothetical protein